MKRKSVGYVVGQKRAAFYERETNGASGFRTPEKSAEPSYEADPRSLTPNSKNDCVSFAAWGGHIDFNDVYSTEGVVGKGAYGKVMLVTEKKSGKSFAAKETCKADHGSGIKRSA